METYYIIKGKPCRYYLKGCLYVSKDGKLAAMPKTKCVLPLEQDSKGNVIVKHKWGHSVSIAKAVITCFCAPKPRDGKDYVVNHKDGDRKNCDYRNLEWQLVHYAHTNKAVVQINVEGTKMDVHKDGTVFLQNGGQLTVRDDSYNADIDLTMCIDPYISVSGRNSIYPKNVFMDNLMKEAGFVNGDDAVLNHPVILHRDNDRMNFAEDNLEWVEETDPRYIAYKTKKKADVHQRNIQLNPRKVLHSGM